MIVRLAVENWMSFRDRAEFSMIASRERQHRKRIPFLEKYDTRVLPIAAIYGGNASGKTNLFHALRFMKDLVVEGTHPDSLIPVEPFRLDRRMLNQPSRFMIELLFGETIYEFSFAVTRREVVEEKLVEIRAASEKILYHRVDGKPNFHRSFDREGLLHFAFQGTRPNQLFLTNSVSQNVPTFRPVYDWFRQCLRLVAPDTRFEAFEHFVDEKSPLRSSMDELLYRLDTGIVRLGGEVIPFDALPIPSSLTEKLRQDIGEGEAARVMAMHTNERYIIWREDGELKAKRPVAFHPTVDGDQVKFDIREESDGTQRIIDLLPTFLTASQSGSRSVFVIDELDRSLHTLLTRQVIESYLSGCSADSRAQVLFTTHDVMLMDQRLLRRDEMWVTERDSEGGSHLIAFSDYKDVRRDKDVRKSYLQGRLGGVPRILLAGAFAPRQGSEDAADTKEDL